MAVIICVIAGSVTPAQADWLEKEKLLPSDGRSGDYFGCSVSISGDVAVVGARYDDDNGDYSGSAYVYRYDGAGWVEEAKLLASDGQEGDYFGGAVSICGQVVLVGAHSDDDNGFTSGSAYVFRYDGMEWVEEAKLLASDGQEGDYFGDAVSISGDTAVIGANHDSDNGQWSGSAYVFRYDGMGWEEEVKLLPSDGGAMDFFGNSVAVSGDRVVIGAQWDDDNGGESGSAYVFRHNGTAWLQEAKLLASDGDAGDLFGHAVSIFGHTAVIGAHGSDYNGGGAGSAYIFRYDGAVWLEQARLLASDGQPEDFFGWSVSICDNEVVVGASGDDDNGEYAGAAYVFRCHGTAWNQEDKLLPSDGQSEDSFGWSVSISGEHVLTGAPYDDDNGSQSGSAYTFQSFECPADFDDDGDVDTADLLTLLGAWGDCPALPCPWDFNGDGVVDELDQEILEQHWGDCPDPPAECPWDLNGDGFVDYQDLVELQQHFGPCPLDECPTDLDGDGDTDTADLLALLAAWGECP